MNKLFIALLLVLLLATPVFAGYYHSLQIEASGEYEITTNFVAPDVAWDLSAGGIGDIRINSVIAVLDYNANWWQLF